jgi:hypothetical protein
MTTNKATKPSKQLNGHGALRAVLEDAFEASDFSRGELTVLSAQVDPYRLDTPSGHRDGEWAAQQFARTRKSQIHWRGLHYSIVARGNVRKPDGEIYRNTDEDWTWLVNVAGKAARWLGKIPFECITDNRNAEPIIHRKATLRPRPSSRSALTSPSPTSMTSSRAPELPASLGGKTIALSSSARSPHCKMFCCRWRARMKPTCTFRPVKSRTRRFT